MVRNTEHIDWLNVFILALLGFYGLFVLLTINQTLFLQQLLYFLLSLVLIYFLSRVDHVFLEWLAPYLYIFSIFLLALSYLGPEIRGATRWLVFGPVRLQPSELVKPLLLLAFSKFMVQFSPRKISNLFILSLLFLLPFLLVFKQPDLGSSIVYACFWLVMLFVGGLPSVAAWLVLPATALSLPLIWRLLADYQKNRILTFLNPLVDPSGAGYNALQAMIAVGSGQFWGRGLGFGTQSHLRFLPEYHTDFIFATLVEELGFLGGVVLLILYLILILRILLPLLSVGKYDTLTYFYVFGLSAIIISQIFINIGMNIGLVPVTGITLPFVSYGGSSLLSLAVSFGFLFVLRKRTS